MKNEFNKELAPYKGGESYRESICFGYNLKTEEFDNYTQLYVTDEIIDFDEEDLTSEQIDLVQKFAEEKQREIRNFITYSQKCDDTDDYLVTASRNW